jgi:hypothetical protein
MATKDISDAQVCRAYLMAKEESRWQWPYDVLRELTGQHENVCFRAMERAAARGFVNYGTSLRSGWVTESGMRLIEEDALKG